MNVRHITEIAVSQFEMEGARAKWNNNDEA